MLDLLNATETPSVAMPTDLRRVSAGVQSIRVLHLINGEIFSGAERVQQLLGLRLPSMGFDPEFCCLKPGQFAECCGLARERLWDAPMRHRLDLSVIQKIAARVRDHGFQLMHAHTPRTAWIASLVARRTSVPWVYHVHSPALRDSTRRLRNLINEGVERMALRNASRIITVSESIRQGFLQRGHSPARVVAIPNGVAEQSPIDAWERLDQSTWRLGMVALIRPRKGIEVLLDAMQRLQGRSHPISLDVIGGFETPDYEAHVKAYAKRLDLGHAVRWRGFTRDVPSEMRQLDALVLPSLFGEGMPMVVLESLALGLPVVATAVEGTPEIVRHGYEGFLAKPNNPESLAKAIADMVADRAAWFTMSRNAVDTHRNQFTDRLMAQRVASSYAWALEATKRGATRPWLGWSSTTATSIETR